MNRTISKLAARLVLPAVLLASPAAAVADGPGHVSADPGLGPAVELANGLYKVRLADGHSLTTHGADGPSGFEPIANAPSRPPVCTPGEHQRILYGRPARAPDGQSKAMPVIQSVLSKANGMLDRAAIESGGRHADYRVKCEGNGRLSVGSFTNSATASFGDVVSAARAAGAKDPDVDYTIFYDDPTPAACGVGSFIQDDRPTVDNANNGGGGYAVIYGDCWKPTTVMHEIGHTQGAVQPGSPNATGWAHCRDEVDIMCYADGAEGPSGMLQRCDKEQWDCGYDDYFDVAPEPDEYLVTHWNTGSVLNRFIQLSDIGPNENAGVGTTPIEPDTAEPDTAEPDDLDETGGADETDFPVEPKIRILGAARVGRSGLAQIRLACPSGRSGACRGSVRVTDASRGSSSRWRLFRIARARSATVAVRLGKGRGARRVLSRGGKLRIVAEDEAADRPAVRMIAVAAPRPGR